jgi:molecular chaperone DnaK (HSP70)
MQRLGAQMDRAKRALSDTPWVTIKLAHGDEQFSTQLDDAGLERICAPLRARYARCQHGRRETGKAKVRRRLSMGLTSWHIVRSAAA